MIYRGTTHKNNFEKFLSRSDPNRLRQDIVSAAYLLGADSRLWARAKHYIRYNRISFDDMPLTGIRTSEFILYKAARNLYLGTDGISISELADREIIPHSLLELIFQAIILKRYGITAIYAAEKNRRNSSESAERMVCK